MREKVGEESLTDLCVSKNKILMVVGMGDEINVLV